MPHGDRLCLEKMINESHRGTSLILLLFENIKAEYAYICLEYQVLIPHPTSLMHRLLKKLITCLCLFSMFI